MTNLHTHRMNLHSGMTNLHIIWRYFHTRRSILHSCRTNLHPHRPNLYREGLSERGQQPKLHRQPNSMGRYRCFYFTVCTNFSLKDIQLLQPHLNGALAAVEEIGDFGKAPAPIVQFHQFPIVVRLPSLVRCGWFW